MAPDNRRSTRSLWEVVVAFSENDPIIQELKAMKRRMDVLYDQSVNDEEPVEELSSLGEQGWVPPMDVWETDAMWVLLADLPGVQDENLSVQVNDGFLNISGRRAIAAPPAPAAAHVSERPCGRFQRSFALPKDARQDHIEAELKGGVLTIKVERKSGESATVRKIPIQSE